MLYHRAAPGMSWLIVLWLREVPTFEVPQHSMAAEEVP